MVCKSMSSTVTFLKNYKSLPIDEAILLAKESLKSLEFHKKLSLIKVFVELCTHKLPAFITNRNIRQNAAAVVLDLLSHRDLIIRKEMYRLCTEKVIAAIGPTLNTSKTSGPGSQILFLLDPGIFIEIALNGASSNDSEVIFRSVYFN